MKSRNRPVKPKAKAIAITRDNVETFNKGDHSTMKKVITALCLILAALAVSMLTQCSSKEKVWKSEGKVKAVATTTMVADLVRVIGGDEVEVYALMKDDVNPHSYDGKPTDVVAMKTSDVIFYSGLHLEHKLGDKLEEMKNAYAVTDGIKKESLVFPENDLNKYADPHVWGDPLLWSHCVPIVVKQLSKVDPENSALYIKRGEAYLKELTALHVWAQDRLSEIPEEYRILVTSHDAFEYFSRAYGLEVKAIDGLSPDDRGGPKKIAALIDFIKEKKIKMIFPEHAVNGKRIEAIAKDAGVAVSKLELFSDATGKAGEMETVNGETYDVGTYLGMIKHNVNAVVEGLK